MGVDTNFTQLKMHLKKKFGKDFFESQEINRASKEVHTVMYRNVMNNLNKTGYDYNQTGDFLSMLRNESKGFHAQTSSSSVKVGFGDLMDFNDTIYMRQIQKHKISAWGKYVTITTKAETQMPKWIIAEFGRSGSTQKADKLPKQFAVNYSRRLGKDMLMGPSGTMRTLTQNAESAKTPRAPKTSGGFGYRKPTYLMMSPKTGANYGVPARSHPGIKPGRFFSGGLRDSREIIIEKYGDAIRDYVK